MKTILALTRESYILCRLFQCRSEEVLLFYMEQVKPEKFLAGKANQVEEQAIAFLAGCSFHSKSNEGCIPAGL